MYYIRRKPRRIKFSLRIELLLGLTGEPSKPNSSRYAFKDEFQEVAQVISDPKITENLRKKFDGVYEQRMTRMHGKFVEIYAMRSDCLVEVKDCDSSNIDWYPQASLIRFENTTQELRDDRLKIRRLCKENKMSEIEQLFKSYENIANVDVDKIIQSNRILKNHHHLLSQGSKYLDYSDQRIQTNTIAVLKNTTIHGLSRIIRFSGSSHERKRESSKMYTGWLRLPAPLVKGSLVFQYTVRGVLKTARLQVHTTTVEDIIFKFEITYNTNWKRNLYVKLSYENEKLDFYAADHRMSV